MVLEKTRRTNLYFTLNMYTNSGTIADTKFGPIAESKKIYIMNYIA